MNILHDLVKRSHWKSNRLNYKSQLYMDIINLQVIDISVRKIYRKYIAEKQLTFVLPRKPRDVRKHVCACVTVLNVLT